MKHKQRLSIARLKFQLGVLGAMIAKQNGHLLEIILDVILIPHVPLPYSKLAVS